MECIDDNFLAQVVTELTRRGSTLDLLLTDKEELHGDVKAGGITGYSIRETDPKRRKNK